MRGHGLFTQGKPRQGQLIFSLSFHQYVRCRIAFLSSFACVGVFGKLFLFISTSVVEKKPLFFFWEYEKLRMHVNCDEMD